MDTHTTNRDGSDHEEKRRDYILLNPSPPSPYIYYLFIFMVHRNSKSTVSAQYESHPFCSQRTLSSDHIVAHHLILHSPSKYRNQIQTIKYSQKSQPKIKSDFPPLLPIQSPYPSYHGSLHAVYVPNESQPPPLEVQCW